jgi:hypothetical protein
MGDPSLDDLAAVNLMPLLGMGAGTRPGSLPAPRECHAVLEFSRHSLVSWAKQT